MLNLFYCDNGVGFAPNPNIYYRTGRNLLLNQNLRISQTCTGLGDSFCFAEF